MNDGQWHHIGVVFPDGGEFNSDVMHFVDGVFDDQSGGGDQDVNTAIGPGAEPVSIGMRVQGANRQFFPGQIADVRIYDEALSESEIKAIMDGLEPEPPKDWTDGSNSDDDGSAPATASSDDSAGPIGGHRRPRPDR